MEQNRICRRCLAKEMPDPEYYQNMYDYIAAMDETIKAPDEVYQNRLSHCKECDSLLMACAVFADVLWSFGLPSGRKAALPSILDGNSKFLFYGGSHQFPLLHGFRVQSPDLFLILFFSR